MARPKRKIDLGEAPIRGLTDLGDGRYRYRCRGTVAHGDLGRFYSKQFRADTKKELEDICAAFRKDVRSGGRAVAERETRAAQSAPSRTTTLATYAQRWLRNRAASGEVAEKTMLRYRGLVRDQIDPTLGGKMLDEITPALINDAIAGWRTMARGDNKKGHLGARTIHHVLSTLSAILASAVDEDILVKNPAAKISVRKSDAREIVALTFAQVAELLAGLRARDAAEAAKLAMPTLVAIGTGLRRGELLGLRYTDIDFEAKVLHVRQSLERLPDRTLNFKEPKTKNSRRSVPLGPSVVAALEAHRFAQAQHGLDFGATFNPHRLVFPWVDGTPWNPDDFSMRFYRAVRKHNLPIVSVHGLRHTHASLGLRSGVAMKIVSETLGHADISITANRYTHSVPAHHVEAMNVIDAAIVAAVEAHATRQPAT